MAPQENPRSNVLSPRPARQAPLDTSAVHRSATLRRNNAPGTASNPRQRDSQHDAHSAELSACIPRSGYTEDLV